MKSCCLDSVSRRFSTPTSLSCKSWIMFAPLPSLFFWAMLIWFVGVPLLLVLKRSEKPREHDPAIWSADPEELARNFARATPEELARNLAHVDPKELARNLARIRAEQRLSQ